MNAQCLCAYVPWHSTRQLANGTVDVNARQRDSETDLKPFCNCAVMQSSF